MEKTETISIADARKLILKQQFGFQLYDEKTPLELTEEIFDRLGYVQIDTLAVVNRSHNHVLWTRNSGFDEGIVDILQSEKRKIFEYWAHAMAYLPIEDYRFYLPKMKSFENPKSKWFESHLKNGEKLLKPVLDRIKAEGPLSSKDFTHTQKKNGSWWDWKPAKIALELLYWRGDLMITGRKNFNKIYDLTERVLPADIKITFPEKRELALFLVKRGLKAYGIASEKELQKYLQPDARRDSDMVIVSREELSECLKGLTENGELKKVKMEGDKTDNYLFSSRFENISSMQPENDVHILSPFDNLIIQRERVQRLFNFDYVIECYLPEAKRKYGYFVMPVLFGNRFAARFDPKADRKEKILTVKNLVFEPDFTSFDEFLPLFALKLKELAKFNNCKRIKIDKVTPGKIKGQLKKFL